MPSSLCGQLNGAGMLMMSPAALLRMLLAVSGSDGITDSSGICCDLITAWLRIHVCNPCMLLQMAHGHFQHVAASLSPPPLWHG
jgi:hypothetical protein